MRKRAESELASVRLAHFCNLQKVFPTTFDKARQQVDTDYENSSRFEVHLLAKYKEGMRDMNANFTLANPNLIGLN